MANILRKIVNLICILKILYYFPFKATLKMIFGFSKEAHMQWAKLTFNFLKVKLNELPKSQPIKEGKIMVFANHRSQADFFLHNVIMNFQTNFLARLAVLVAIPGFCVSYKTVWFFNRGQKTDPEKFNSWLDKKFAESNRPALLAYPQGHRMQGTSKVQSIKTGMIKYGYRRQLPSQILISFGNEQVMDEKSLHLSWGSTVTYRISEVIDPKDFASEAEYTLKIKQRFVELFDEGYADHLNYKANQLEQIKNQKQ